MAQKLLTTRSMKILELKR
ncbi:hypothetical protein AYI68_g8067, partial [Smittium mucronatum]